MLISTKGRYALSVLVELARQEKEAFITLKEIAEKQCLSQKYLETIFKPLCAACIVEGVRGKHGGYRLKIDPDVITVYDIVDIAENGIAPVAPLHHQSELSPNEESFMWVWEGLEEKINTFLKELTLKDLTKKPENI